MFLNLGDHILHIWTIAFFLITSWTFSQIIKYSLKSKIFIDIEFFIFIIYDNVLNSFPTAGLKIKSGHFSLPLSVPLSPLFLFFLIHFWACGKIKIFPNQKESSNLENIEVLKTLFIWGYFHTPNCLEPEFILDIHKRDRRQSLRSTPSRKWESRGKPQERGLYP